MSCSTYNKSLTHAAASGELSPAQREHLGACESCRIAFAEEQSLFAAIDSGLRAAANSEIPATLIPRIRVAFNDEPAPQRRSFSFLVWSFASAVVTAGVVLGLIHLSSKPALVEPSRPAPVAVAQNSPERTSLNSARTGGVSPLQHNRPAVLIESHDSRPESPEVLVPDEERAAFAQYVAQISTSPANISVRSALAPRGPQESVQISPVEIASLEPRQLDQKEGRQDQF